MRAQEFLVERWTARTVRDYFDSKENKHYLSSLVIHKGKCLLAIKKNL